MEQDGRQGGRQGRLEEEGKESLGEDKKRSGRKTERSEG